MNRRELVTSLTAGLVAAGISTDAVAIQPLEAPVDPKGTLVVLRFKGQMSMAQAEKIQDYWKRKTQGTDWEGVRCLVIDDQVSMEVHQHRS